MQSILMGAPQHVASAVQNASARTGVDFKYLMKQAQVESSFDADAKAKSSSATGLYQFIDQTWLRMVKEHGGEYGKAAWSDAISQGKDGRFHVSGDMKATILNARKDPEFSSLMAGEFASENKEILEEKTGREANATDLYMAHFLGAGGASTFLNAMQDNPLQSASVLFPNAAKSNHNVFYNADGTSKSLAEVYEKFASKFEGVTDSPVYKKEQPKTFTADLKSAPVPDQIDAMALLDVQPSNTGAASHNHLASPSAYLGIQSPIQSSISSDLISAPLLSLFTSRNAENNTSDNKDGDQYAMAARGFDAFSFNA